MYYNEDKENEQDEYRQNTFDQRSQEQGAPDYLKNDQSSFRYDYSDENSFEDTHSYHYSYSNQDNGQYSGSGQNSRNYTTTMTNRRFNKTHLLMVVILILLVAVVSILSCMIYLKLSGQETAGFKVNQEDAKASASKPTSSVEAAGTEALTTPQVVKAVIPTVVEVNVASFQGTGSGSGIIFSEDGYIITNQHVVEGADTVAVKLSDGKEYEATIVGEDEQTDLAVLKVKAKGLPAAAIGKSDDLVQGETVLVIGNPLGETLSGSVSQGIVSALGREIEIEGRKMHYIQTDAAINPGNSGGPLVNQSGQVVGIASAKISSYQLSSSQTEGLGFAIPIDEAVPVIEDLINHGYVSGRPLIGISGETVSEQISIIYDIPQGIYVRYVDNSSGAAKAGIHQGDVIIAADGKETTTMDELNSVRDEHKAGETIRLTVYRNGEKKEIDVVLGEQTVAVSK